MKIRSMNHITDMREKFFSNAIAALLSRYSKWILFTLITIVVLAYSFNNKSPFYYDAKQYSDLGATFEKDGFSFLNYTNTLRGYLFPFLLYILQHIARFLDTGEVRLFRVCFSMVIAFFVVFLVPSFFSKLTRRRVSFFSTAVFAVLFLYFWIGYSLYPLTDIPALSLAILGLYWLFIAMETAFKPAWKSVALFFLSGAALAASQNLRPSYQIILVPLAIYFAFKAWKSFQKWWMRIMALALISFGMTLIFLPQVFINYNNFKTINPFVMTNKPGRNDLFVSQLNWGIWMQRYETYVANDYPDPRVRFIDPLGETLLDSAKVHYPKQELTTYQVFRLIARHPFEFIVIYSRHFFNGMDMVYNTPYVDNLFHNRIVFSWLNYSIQFLALFTILMNLNALKNHIEPLFCVLILLIPAVLSIPVAVETRFFLGFHILFYTIVSFYFSNYKLQIKKLNPFAFTFLYFLYIALCFIISFSVFSNLELSAYLMN